VEVTLPIKEVFGKQTFPGVQIFQYELQMFPTTVSSIEVMPEFYVFLPLLPAKENFAPSNNRREINQPAVKVLDQNLSFLEFQENFLHSRKSANPLVDSLASNVVSRLHETYDSFLVTIKVLPQTSELFQPLTDLRKKFPCFIACVML
jgi:hypothetical protein